MSDDLLGTQEQQIAFIREHLAGLTAEIHLAREQCYERCHKIREWWGEHWDRAELEERAEHRRLSAMLEPLERERDHIVKLLVDWETMQTALNGKVFVLATPEQREALLLSRSDTGADQ